MTHSVLITGSMGYLGGPIACRLSEQLEFELLLGELKAEDSLPKWLKRGNLVSLDILCDKDLAIACRNVQSIIHLAALNEVDSTLNPEQALITNSLGTLKLLQAAETAGVKRFIYFSTAHVYGASLVDTITEKTIPRPVHPYAITHRSAEDFVLAAHDRKALCGIVLRLSNVVGAPMHPNIKRWTLVGNDFCRQAITNKKIVLHSSGLQVRDFITLEDVSKVVLHFLRLPTSECNNGIFNVGGENPMSIIDIAKLISFRCTKVIGFTPEIVQPKPSQNEKIPQTLTYNISKLKSTGFRLQGNLDSEIDNTLKLCLNAFEDKSKDINRLP